MLVCGIVNKLASIIVCLQSEQRLWRHSNKRVMSAASIWNVQGGFVVGSDSVDVCVKYKRHFPRQLYKNNDEPSNNLQKVHRINISGVMSEI